MQRNEMKRCKPKDKTAERWVMRRRGSEMVPAALREHYSVKEWIPQLDGALLSKNGVDISCDGTATGAVHVCPQCFSSMKTGSKPPKFAIANGFDIGMLPASLADSRSIEKRLMSMISVVHSVTVLKGGKHKSLRGHVSFMRMDPSTVTTELPRLLKEDDETFLVIMAGKFTSAQKLLAMRRYQVRVEKLRRLLHFYISNNEVYRAAGLSIDENAMRVLEESEQFGAGVTVVKTSEGGGEKEMELEPMSLQNDSDALLESDLNDDERYENDICQTNGTKSKPSEELFEKDTACLGEEKNTVVVSNNPSYFSDYDKNILALAFPELFPYGRGHPGTEREIPVSFEECCRYYLCLGNRKFSQHQYFVLVAFDICARHRVIGSTCIRSKSRPGEFEDIGNVTGKELAETLQEQRKQRKIALLGRIPQLKRDRLSRAGRLLNQVKVSQSNMWGSSEERLVYRRKAFSMDAFLKTGAIFVTITPCEEGTLSIAAIAGRVCEESIRRLEIEDLPYHAVRKRIAGIDPVACCEYFESVCQTFIEDVVGFNQSEALPYMDGGIFGHVKAFLGVVEAQQSGKLHLHAILSVAGLPRTAREFSSKCQDKKNGARYKSSLCSFVDSIIKTSIPASPNTNDQPICPSYGCLGSLVSKKKVEERAFKRQAKRSSPEKTSICGNCNSGFGACEVLRSEVKRLHDSLTGIKCSDQRRIPMGSSYQETDQLTSHHSLNPIFPCWPPRNESENSEIGKLHRLFISRVALLTQQHNYNHVDSCFKRSASSKEGHCRYGFPRPPVENTHINEHLCLVLDRKAHNEYINGYNDVMLALFRTNHDLRFLLEGTANALYYVMKYVTKATENNSAVESAIMASYERRCRIEKEASMERMSAVTFRTGRARVNSMAVSLSKMQEVPATLCALYLRRKTALFASHGFEKLLLVQSMAIVKQQEHETELIMRPDGRRIRIPRSSRSTTTDKDQERSSQKTTKLYHLRKEHPLSNTHCLVKRRVAVIPEIVGPQMPNIDSLDSEDEKEKLGLMALILFCPFETDSDLTQGTGSYWRGYEKFSTSGKMSRRSRDMFENMQEYYISKKTSAMECKVLENLRALYTEEDAAATDNGAEDFRKHSDSCALEEASDYLDDADGVSSISLALDGFEGRYESETNVQCRKMSTELSVKICVTEQQVQTADNPQRIWKAHEHTYPEFVNAETEAFDAKKVELGYKFMSSVVHTSVDEDNSLQWQRNGCSYHEDEDNTTVETLKEILSKKNAMDVEIQGMAACGVPLRARNNITCGHFVSLEQVAETFSLNELQRKAFMLSSYALLEKIAEGYEEFL